MHDRDKFNYLVDQFDDMRILRYELPRFNTLTTKQKELIYYLGEAALSGRDIIWDQNFRFNLQIRKTIEAVLNHYPGDRGEDEFKAFVVYAKRVFFTNGIHHHYSSDKLKPGFTARYFSILVESTPEKFLPLKETEKACDLVTLLSQVIFDEQLFARRTELKTDCDLVEGSAINFYERVTQKEVEKFYSTRLNAKDPRPLSTGLNTKVLKAGEELIEDVYRSGGLYGKAIDKIVHWLEKAIKVAESDVQREGIKLLITFYKTGDLKAWDEFNMHWVKDTVNVVDFINGFIETYSDPMGMKATWESVVQYTDPEATKRTRIITENAQWFEDNSPIDPQYRKEKVKGIAAKVINIAMLGGDCYPASPLGINLPNADWIRKEIGSKSVTLANIKEAYDITSRGNGFLEEFAVDNEEIDRIRKFGSLSDSLHTDLHECVGHASGKMAEGTDPNSLRNYASTLEETRADLVALYFMPDKKMTELGLLPDAEAAKAEYDAFIRNGLLTQLVKIQLGKDIEEAHMRNRAAISRWVFERGEAENVVLLFSKEGKTYVKINDYLKLRKLFGELLKEVQRIKSEGDFLSGKNFIEKYGVKVDMKLHAEILSRYEKLNLAPYTGFVNPVLKPVYDGSGNITDVKAEYTEDYLGQMLEYGKNYSFL
jgi:dipeptidyl-peptidase-3